MHLNRMYLDGLHLMLSFQIVEVFLLILATARPFLLPLQTSIQFTQFFKEQKHCLEGLGRKWLYLPGMRHYTQKTKLSNGEMPMNLIIFFNRMDWFHRATNYMEDIGIIMEGSGFEDCLVESTAMPLLLKSIEERHTIGEWEPINYSLRLSQGWNGNY